MCKFYQIFLIFVNLYGSISASYMLYPEVNMHYKFHRNPRTWFEARQMCKSEGSILAIPKNAAEKNVLLRIFNGYPATTLSGVRHPDFFLLGFHDMFNEGEFITTKGEPLQNYYHSWVPGQPDNTKGAEDCGSLHRSGGLNDYSCSVPAVFICEKNGSNSQIHQGNFDCLSPDPGYKFSKVLNKCYKLHLNPRIWAIARTICYAKGGHLAIINSKQEEDFLLSMFTNPEDRVTHVVHKDFALLGFHDIYKEGNFVTVTDESLQSSGYVRWGRGQPDNARGNENCGSMHVSGVLNDFSCSIPAVFFCELEASNRVENTQYVHYPEVDVSYKYYSNSKTWPDARLHCLAENATLAMPKNEAEANIIKSIFEKNRKTSDYVLLGFHDLFTEGDFITESGVPIQYFYHVWANGQPDNYRNEEDCGSMHRSGKLNDYTCKSAATFVCQRSNSQDPPNPIGCSENDPAYEFEPTSGKQFKLHMDPKTWDTARIICQTEGGRLAVINSKQEEDFLVKIFNDPKNKVHHVRHKDYALLGFHDIFKEGHFVTVSGENLNDTKYVSWNSRQPDNNGSDENCGSMHSSGKLNDFPCSVPAVYFCEKLEHVPNIDVRTAN